MLWYQIPCLFLLVCHCGALSVQQRKGAADEQSWIWSSNTHWRKRDEIQTRSGFSWSVTIQCLVKMCRLKQYLWKLGKYKLQYTDTNRFHLFNHIFLFSYLSVTKIFHFWDILCEFRLYNFRSHLIHVDILEGKDFLPKLPAYDLERDFQLSQSLQGEHRKLLYDMRLQRLREACDVSLWISIEI